MRLCSDLDCELCKLAKACDEERVRKPYSGNLFVRFDEGSGVIPRSYSTGPQILAALPGSAREPFKNLQKHDMAATLNRYVRRGND